MIPNAIDVDRPLPAAGAIGHALEENAVASVGADARLTRLHRVFYPVFRVEYCYSGSSAILWSDRTDRGVTLLDGLWADNHAVLQQYRSATDSLGTVSLDYYDFGRDEPGLGRTVLLDFQVPAQRARQLLPERFDDVAESRAFGDPKSITASFADRLRETFGLPDALDLESFEGVVDVTRLYLPFWVCEVYRPDERDLIGVVRNLEDARTDDATHGWLSAFFREDKSRLARYAHTSIREAIDRSESADRVDREVDTDGSAVETDDERSSDDRQPDGATAREDGDNDRDADGNGDEDEAEADDRRTDRDGPVQPEDAELDAETLVDPSPNRCFADVGGMVELERTLRRSVIGPVQRPDEFREYGLDPVSGVLLHGPPGCGKTHVAGALAGELDYAFLEVTPADLSSKYMGKPAENVQDVFAIAEANAPCVLFLDEIDAIASAREDQSSTSERGMVNQLLTELEDVGDDVLVLAATNLLDDVDDAIVRTGRFDEQIEVPPPDEPARREILRIHLEERPLADGLELDPVVDRTAGYAASDLEYIATDAARRALRADERIGTDHLLAAAEEVDSSVPDWAGSALGDGKTITQPDGVELSARSLVTPSVDRDFDDVGGMDALKDRLHETVIDPFENADRYAEYGLGTTGGILLYGPPGCGKTHVAGALAGELDVAFLEVSPADLSSKWMGKPAQNVADLFEIARQNAPCLVFLDEIDAIAGARGGHGSGGASQRQMVNQLLTELESLESADEDVVVVAATNRPGDVDDAVLRSGRFDERIEVSPPDAAARKAILQVHLADRPVAEGCDWDTVVERTSGYAASDLALLADNAARRAMHDGDQVRERHLADAIAETTPSLERGGESTGAAVTADRTGSWYR
ncbi:ATP-binding protein [Halopiger xanaduensis]|uniref:AAA ATPase central domain protein n=1 Tax=Halopiger xanaduensis (strain DSM 18323 / JCM 14033 / SH-6) TaxID=797210 RepID=F8D478_HALXS|nr:ATP-binding protein [Halopiger xanaduensis]AEH37478.1 AAA ATPase central domain protein [Halopiger xanaduensis SH-6]